MEINKIYFDNAATTPVREEVFAEMTRVLAEFYGNPSSVYKTARDAKKIIETAREKTAAAIHAQKREIYFTGGGTESDNWAIKGVAEAYASKGSHIITQATEHHAVLHVCEYLQKRGFDVTFLPVDAEGLVSPSDVAAAITDKTILVTIMFANNEIGAIQPIAEIGRICRERGVIFHTDAVQAVGHVPVDVSALNVDLLSLSAHKIYGPKGVGALYIRQGVKLPPLIHGGAQERGKRAGTENVAGIAGLGTAIELITAEMAEENARIAAIRDRIIDSVLSTVPYSRLNGPRGDVKRLPGNVNISFEFIEGESILLLLDSKGISASSGSACTSGSLDPSHVLLAIGLPHEKAHGSLRVSLGRYNKIEDADALLRELPPIVQRLRDMSPLYADATKCG